MNKHTSLKDYVYKHILDKISSGNIAPEEKLNEHAISLELNVSRTPVREALIQLEHDGIIERSPKRGYVVKTLTLKEARNAYIILGALDGFSAYLACDKLTDKDISNMKFHIGAMDLAIESNNTDMYFTQEEQFHMTYTNLCDNEEMSDMIIRLRAKFLRKMYKMKFGKDYVSVLKEINAEHRIILDYFEKKDARGVQEYIQNIHWNPIHSHNDVIE